MGCCLRGASLAYLLARDVQANRLPILLAAMSLPAFLDECSHQAASL